MSLAYPLGFLALIGIPVLIFIYIIKNRYTEQTVSSTYLWTLSERFLKRRIPINRITGILSLILQILAVIMIALILVHPVFYVPNSAQAYCFILDGSGSMNIVQDGETRFDIGKKKIVDIINGSMLGSTYTYICAGQTTATVFENDNNKERAVNLINDSDVSYTSTVLTDAIGAAQRYFNNFPYAKMYLITDKNYERTENIEIINVSSAAENYALSEVEQDTQTLNIKGKVTSYESDAELTLNLYLDGAETVASTQKINVKKFEGENDAVEFEFDCSQRQFATAKVEIAESDALELDNEAVIYKAANQNMSRTLLVSDNRFFAETLLNRSGIYAQKEDDGSSMNYLLDVIPTSKYRDDSGYGLYIFDTFVPEELPQEGAVWFINPTDSVKNSNFSYQSAAVPTDEAEYSDSDNTIIASQLAGVNRENSFYPRTYAKLSLNGRFSTLVSCDNNPLIFTGTNAYGNREVVFAFDLRDSAEFILSGNAVVLFGNMIKYAFPEIVTETSYFCGDTLLVNMIPNCRSISIESPLGKVSYPDTSSTTSEYTLEEVGTYKINLTMKDESVISVNVYSSIPLEERIPAVTEASFRVQGTPENRSLTGMIDNLLVIFIILAVIAVADYGVYCYEQYQLR